MRINVLAPETIDKIAAGEVVQRPASVVKELIDNAIDAGAQSITVELQGSDMPDITVRDDGSGMSSEELILAVQRHTTSKIKEAEDLASINTLGFRGEALASIAAVSKISITTRRQEENQGSLLEINGGKTGEIAAAASPVGTRIAVRELFFNTPARRKFLRARTTENAAITEVVQQMAVAWPEIRFRLLNNNRTILSSPGNGRQLDAIAAVAGAEVARGMIATSWTEGNLSVNGYISHPRLHRSNRSWQYFSVNRRPVQLRLAASAVEKAYHTLLPRDRHPLMFLNLEVPPELVDVNVHPAKTEIKFSDSSNIYRLFLQTAHQALFQADTSQQAEERVEENNSTFTSAGEKERLFPPLRGYRETPRFDQISFSEQQSEQPMPAGWTLIGQILSTYLVVDNGDGLLLVDQHAAQERIMYEMYTDMLEQGQRPSQLVLPLEIDLPAHLLQFARGQQALLNQLGFGFRVSDSGIVLSEVPLVFRKALSTEDVTDILEHLMEGSGQTSLSDHSQAALMMMACKSALKARQNVSPAEGRQLLEQLSKCRNSETCPHGRPVFVHINRLQLEKMFARR